MNGTTDIEASLAEMQARMLAESSRAEGYLKIISELEAMAARAEARAIDEVNRAQGYLRIIGELEAKVAASEAHRIDEFNRAEGYLKVIRDVEARATRAENRLAALREGGPPEFPLLDQDPEYFRRDIDRYVAAIPNRIEIASYIHQLVFNNPEQSSTSAATSAYLHYLLGDYQRAHNRLMALDLANLARVIPNAQRTWPGLVWLLVRFGHREAAATLLDRLAHLSDAHFEALQVPGATLGRQSDARARGVPAILFNTTPKSGTVFLQNALAHVVDAPMFRVSLLGFAYDLVVPGMVRQFAMGGAVCFNHFPASARNLEILARSGLRKIIIHVRDPRQCVTSLIKSTQHAWSVDHSVTASGLHYGGEIQAPDDYQEMRLSDRQKWIVMTYAPIYCHWIESWLAASRDFEGLQIKFVTYENFVRDKSDYYTEVAEFFGLDVQTIVPRLLEIEPRQDVMHFRKGRVDEWREVLTEAERELFWSLMKPTLAAEFGWPE